MGMKNNQVLNFVAHSAPEYSAGLRGFTEEIQVSFKSGGWDFDEDDENFIAKSLKELLDCESVVTTREYERQIKSETVEASK